MVRKVVAGVTVLAAGVALTTVTFGGAAPLTVVITATIIGTAGAAGTNAAIQYANNGGSWENFNLNECINAGLRNKHLLNTFCKSYVKSSVVSNARNIITGIGHGIKELIELCY